MQYCFLCRSLLLIPVVYFIGTITKQCRKAMMPSVIYAYKNIAVITLKRAKYWSLGKAVESVVQQLKCRHEWHLDGPKVCLLVVASFITYNIKLPSEGSLEVEKLIMCRINLHSLLPKMGWPEPI